MLKYEIREICGDWAIWQQYETDQGSEEKILLILNSYSNAKYVKAILELEAQNPNAAVPYRPEVAQMSDEQVVAIYRLCCGDYRTCTTCPFYSKDGNNECENIERRVLAIAERALGDRHDH